MSSLTFVSRKVNVSDSNRRRKKTLKIKTKEKKDDEVEKPASNNDTQVSRETSNFFTALFIP